MKVILQRVTSASVCVDDKEVGSIDRGLLLLVGFGTQDSETCIQPMIEKILKLRIFPSLNKAAEFDISLEDIQGEILLVSQFTLYADCSEGRRPSFSKAMAPQQAKIMYDKFCQAFRIRYQAGKIAEGVFGAMMVVSLLNDGPVTISLES